jgi:hypothetical protein
MRTQNPPPLKACRFDSDLGTTKILVSSVLAGTYARCRNRRIGLSTPVNLIASAKAVTHFSRNQPAIVARLAGTPIADPPTQKRDRG